MTAQQNSPGKVYLVGAGPGDPSLITVRGRELIESCDVLAYDFLAAPEMCRWAREDCERICVGKRAGRHTIPQEEIIALLVEKARLGKTVVRLKGGDPLLFGRGGEEAAALHGAGIEFEIVPGVTAALAASAYAGVPLTQRDLSSSVCFLTGHEDIAKERMHLDFRQFARIGGTLCIYMGMGHLEKIVAELRDGGLSGETPAAIIQEATLPSQRSAYGQLDELPAIAAKEGLGAPAIVVIGDVAKLHSEVNWYPQKPLLGKRIVLTRTPEQAQGMTRELRALGADVLELPMIEITYTVQPGIADEIFSGLGGYQWIVFTSPNGVEGFFRCFFQRHADLREFGPMRIACIGEPTAQAVRKRNLEVDLVPPEATAEALGKALIADGDLENQNVLLVTGNRNRPDLARDLEGPGAAIVDTFPVYETHLRELDEADEAACRFRSEGADALVFASPSAAENFIKQAGKLQISDGGRTPKAYSIGPITSAAMQKAGIPIAGEATNHDAAGIIDLLLRELKRS